MGEGEGQAGTGEHEEGGHVFEGACGDFETFRLVRLLARPACVVLARVCLARPLPFRGSDMSVWGLLTSAARPYTAAWESASAALQGHPTAGQHADTAPSTLSMASSSWENTAGSTEMLLVPKQALEDLLQSIASTQQCLTQVLQTATTGNTGDTEQNFVSAPTAKRKAAVPRTGRSRSRERTPTGRRAKGRSKKEVLKKEEVKEEGSPEMPEEEEEEEETQPPATGKAAATTAKSAGEGPPATGKGKAGGKRPAPPPGPPPRGTVALGAGITGKGTGNIAVSASGQLVIKKPPTEMAGNNTGKGPGKQRGHGFTALSGRPPSDPEALDDYFARDRALPEALRVALLTAKVFPIQFSEGREVSGFKIWLASLDPSVKEAALLRAFNLHYPDLPDPLDINVRCSARSASGDALALLTFTAASDAEHAATVFMGLMTFHRTLHRYLPIKVHRWPLTGEP